MGSAQSKKVRQQRLEAALIKNPFLTDAHLAEQFEVSIQTIRLDRLALGIPELRERTRHMAENAQKKLQAITSEDIVGELIDLEIGVSGISMMTVNKEMVLQKTGVCRGQYMFAQANSLALAVIDAPKYTIWVKIRNNRKEVFRAKFLIVSLPEERNQENENRS